MLQPRRSPAPSLLGFLVLLVVLVGGGAATFAYTAGWLSPERLTPVKMVEAFKPPGGVPLGHRKNHAKGICFTGVFEANGAGSALSRAQVFAAGQYPALGRFNLGTPNPDAPDATVRVRGMALRISPPDGQEWRAAMINAPVFPVSTPQGFYELLNAAGSKEPDAMKTFVAAHPEFAPFGEWATKGPWTGSYAEERYNSLNSFIFTDNSGAGSRGALVAAAGGASGSRSHPRISPSAAPTFSSRRSPSGSATAPQRWTLVVTIANPGDPTADPTKAWPADRRTVEVGTLIVQKIEAEADGPCRDINFDPTVLPAGIRTSDDPFPAARSAAYARSYDLRTAEAKDYPRTATDAQP